MPAESQSQNSVRGAPLAQDQPQKPNPLPDHMKVPLITRHAPAQPRTKNPTPTTNQSRTCSEISALIDFKLLGSIFGIVFLVWFVLWFGPSINDFSAFTLSSATVHPFNISSSRLTAAWDISFDVDSLHLKRGVEYDHVHASIYYGPHLLSEVTIPSIFVRMFGTTTVHARLVVHSALVDVGAAESMVRDRALRGAVDFRFGLVARYNQLPLPWDTWVIRVSCENVTVGFPASDDVGPGVLLGPPRKCSHLVDET